MRNSEAIPFNCPSCEAEYKIVRIESPSDAQYRKIFCLRCDALFPAGDEGGFYKYFLVRGRRRKRR
jgi:hypothetical protein